MSVTLAQIKADQLQARKDRDTVKAALLTTLIGEVEGAVKGMDPAKRNDNTEAETIQAKVKKFLDDNRDSQAHYQGMIDQGIEINYAVIEHGLNTAKAEQAVLETYRPAQLTAEQIEQIFRAEFPLGVEQKQFGRAMAILKANYANQYDGTLASTVLKQLIV